MQPWRLSSLCSGSRHQGRSASLQWWRGALIGASAGSDRGAFPSLSSITPTQVRSSPSSAGYATYGVWPIVDQNQCSFRSQLQETRSRFCDLYQYMCKDLADA